MDRRSDEAILEVMEAITSVQLRPTHQSRLVLLQQQHIQALTRNLGVQLSRVIIESDESQALDIEEGIPVPVSPRQFCELMSPYLCMN